MVTVVSIDDHVEGKKYPNPQLNRFMRKIESIRRSKEDKKRARRMIEEAEIERQNGLPMGAPENLHKIATTFDPIEKYLDSIVETGEFDVANNVAVFQTTACETEWLPVAESFRAVCDVFELISKEMSIEPHTRGFRQLANKIDVRMMLFQSDIDAARASIAWMRNSILAISPNAFSVYSAAIMAQANKDGRGNAIYAAKAKD